jgi:hypothetical protein
MDPRVKRLRRIALRLQGTAVGESSPAMARTLWGLKALLVGAVYSLRRVCELTPGEDGCKPFYRSLDVVVTEGLDELRGQEWPANGSWLAEHYLNSALFRMDCALHVVLQVLLDSTAQLAALMETARKRRLIKAGDLACLGTIHKDINKYKHKGGLFQARAKTNHTFSTAARACNILVGLFDKATTRKRAKGEKKVSGTVKTECLYGS